MSPSFPAHGDGLAQMAAATPAYTECTIDIALRHVFAITLLGSSRNVALAQTCAEERLPCVFTPAVSKDVLDPAQLAKISHSAPTLLGARSSIIQHNLTAGEFALSLSHRNVYDTIILNQIPCAIVFESDAALVRGFAMQLRSLHLPAELDLLKLESCNRATGARGSSASATPTMTTRLARGQGFGWGAAAYLVTARGARLLRALQTPVWLQADAAFRVLDPRNNRHLNEALAALAANPGRWNVTNPGLRPIEIFHSVPFLAWQRYACGESIEREGAAVVWG